jgi:hypothetical protein
MKQQFKKFSDDRQSEETSEALYHQPDDPQKHSPSQRPVAHDLRIVVKESLNLGKRFITEIDMMLRKLQD